MPSLASTSSSSPTARLDRILAACRLFSPLDEGLRQALAARATTRRLVRGERIWRTGDAATHFTIVQNGLVKIVRATPGGTETIVAIFGPRESIGDAAVLERVPYPADAVVASDTADVVRVDASVLLAAMEDRADVARAMNKALLEHMHALHEKIRVMSAGSVPKRLATLFLGLVERFGDEGEEGQWVVPVVISRIELAALIGARVETTIRTIRRWERAGIIETTADGFRIRDVDALGAMTRDARPDDGDEV